MAASRKLIQLHKTLSKNGVKKSKDQPKNINDVKKPSPTPTMGESGSSGGSGSSGVKSPTLGGLSKPRPTPNMGKSPTKGRGR